MRALVPLLVVLVLAAPLAHAHLDYERPILQAGQPPRNVDILSVGGAGEVTLYDRTDPLRNVVWHDVQPARGLFRVEHRADPPQASDAFWLQVEMARLVEYKDFNTDGRLTEGLDNVVKTWRLASPTWRATEVQNASVGGATGRIISWDANLSGGPRVELILAATGLEVADEGARARPQDVLLYLDFVGMPPRGTGHLHALEGTFTAPANADLAPILSDQNATVGVRADGDGRRALFVWGGQAQVDGREQSVGFHLGEPTVADGNATWPYRLHFPIMDEGAHLVLVSGIEYEVRGERTPLAPWLAPLALAGAGLARAGSKRFRRSRESGG